MTSSGARCPTCHSVHIEQTFRTWCATYLHCGDCGDRWTVRHHPDSAEDPHDLTAHPRRRHTDDPVGV